MNMIAIRAERKIRNHNRRLVNEIMDLRDQRVCLQRKVIMLEDKQLWEPYNFNSSDMYWLKYYKSQIDRIKATEEELRKQLRA